MRSSKDSPTGFQRSDPLFKRRVAQEQTTETRSPPTNTKCRELTREILRFLRSLERLECINHLAGTGEFRAPFIGLELAVP